MTQEANNWAHTTQRGGAATTPDTYTTSAPTLVGGMNSNPNSLAMGMSGQQPFVDSAELRPYQSGRLGLDSEMGVGIDHHGPNGPYPTRPMGVEQPHLNASGVHSMNMPSNYGSEKESGHPSLHYPVTHPHGHQNMAHQNMASGHSLTTSGNALPQANTGITTPGGASTTHSTKSSPQAVEKEWKPKQFGPMPPGSTIRDPAHHPGFATHVVTESIPVTDAMGHQATITKQTVITAQQTIVGQIHRDYELLQTLFAQWFATHDLQQRELLWWQIEHELQQHHAGHDGVMASAFKSHLTKDQTGYDSSRAFHEYGTMSTLLNDMNQMKVSDSAFDQKMAQLQRMTRTHYDEIQRYLPMLESRLTNQQLIDMGTAYNMKKSGVKNTRHSNRLEKDKNLGHKGDIAGAGVTDHSNTASAKGATYHDQHQRDRESAAESNKYVDPSNKPTLMDRLKGKKTHDDTTTHGATNSDNKPGIIDRLMGRDHPKDTESANPATSDMNMPAAYPNSATTR